MMGMKGPGIITYELDSQVMMPTHAHRTSLDITSRNHWDSKGVEVTIAIEVDGARKVLFSRIYTSDDLADAYELAHHETHGYDPRGLDPREGKTRLKP